VIIGIAILVALTVDAKQPSWALRSEWVYRAEVGAAIVGLLYVPLVALALAWRGETFRKILAPGGAGVETPAERIGTAAERFGRYDEQVEERFEKLENAADKLNRRVEKLEGGKDAGG
jgi:hypothetical protein